MKTQGKQYMILSSRVEAAAMTMQSISSMSGVPFHLYSER